MWEKQRRISKPSVRSRSSTGASTCSSTTLASNNSRLAGGLSDAYRQIFDVNVFGVSCGYARGHTGDGCRRSGIVVNVSSDSARAPEPGHGAYAASKAAVAAFTEAVAYEVADRGVYVHVLYPAWVPTAMGMSGVDDGGSLPPKTRSKK